jgi:hypothetical protein
MPPPSGLPGCLNLPLFGEQQAFFLYSAVQAVQRQSLWAVIWVLQALSLDEE